MNTERNRTKIVTAKLIFLISHDKSSECKRFIDTQQKNLGAVV